MTDNTIGSVEWLEAAYRDAVKERDELCTSADAHSEMMERARVLYQEAHPGTEDRWPDGAKNIVWLLERLEQQTAEIKRLREENKDAAARGLSAEQLAYINGAKARWNWAFGGSEGLARMQNAEDGVPEAVSVLRSGDRNFKNEQGQSAIAGSKRGEEMKNRCILASDSCARRTPDSSGSIWNCKYQGHQDLSPHGADPRYWCRHPDGPMDSKDVRIAELEARIVQLEAIATAVLKSEEGK